MPKTSPAFQLYASDFDMDTATWDNEEIGIYFRLLLYQWVNGSIPDDSERLSRISRCSVKKFIGKWKYLSPKFVPKGDGYLVNQRMEEVRKTQDEWRQKQIESGRLGGLKTQERKRIISSEPSSEPSSEAPSENQALQSSSSSSLKNKNIYSANFENAWKGYPMRNGRKAGKEAAFREWKKINPDEELVLKILTALEKQKDNYSKLKKSGKFVAEFPDAARWLKERRWEDEIAEPKGSILYGG